MVLFFIYVFPVLSGTIENMWKESILVPEAKVKSSEALNDNHPLALTSLDMKTFQHIQYMCTHNVYLKFPAVPDV